MNTNIRKSVAADLAIITQLEREVFAEFQQSSRRALQLSLNSSHQQVWVIECMEEGATVPAGCLILYLYPKTLRIFSIAVFSRFQNQGLGLLLLKQAEKVAEERGIKKISLELNSHNTQLLQWYKKAGYNKVSELPDYYDTGINGLRMAKILTKV